MQLLVAAPGVGDGLQVGIDGVYIVLYIHIQAGVDVVAAVAQQGVGSLPADTLELHQVIYNIVNDYFSVVRVDGLGIFFPGAAGEYQLLGHRILILLVIDIALLIHLPQDGLLALFVVLLIIEGVIIGGQVGDAHDGGALRQGQVLGVLAEIGLGRHLHAVTALTEADGVKIPLHYLLLVITLLQLKGSEYFRELALDGDVVLAGKVLYQLLGDGGTAVAGVHFGEHGDEGAGSAVPVHALVLIKAFVFNGHQGFFQIPGQVLIVHPHTLFAAGEGGQLPPLAAGVLIPEGAGLVELQILKTQIEAGHQAGLYIVGKDAGEHHSRHQEDEQYGADHLQNCADGAGYKVTGDIGGFFYNIPFLFRRLGFRAFLFAVLNVRALFAH